MTDQRIARPAPPDTPDPEDHERLLEAARSALTLLDRMDEHMPADLAFGGETKVRKQLRTAIRLASFELRLCPDCMGGGTVPGPTSYPMQRPEPADCPTCDGVGERRVFAYPKPRRRR